MRLWDTCDWFDYQTHQRLNNKLTPLTFYIIKSYYYNKYKYIYKS